jgi:hypothetical protein
MDDQYPCYKNVFEYLDILEYPDIKQCIITCKPMQGADIHDIDDAIQSLIDIGCKKVNMCKLHKMAIDIMCSDSMSRIDTHYQTITVDEIDNKIRITKMWGTDDGMRHIITYVDTG